MNPESSNKALRVTVSVFVVAAFAIGAVVFTLSGNKDSATNSVLGNTSSSTTATDAQTLPSAAFGNKTSVSAPSSRSNSDDGNDSESGDDDNTKTPPPVDTTKKPVTSSVSASVTAGLVYKNGTYNTTGSYDSPAGQEQIGVSITIQNDVVTSANVTAMAHNRTSVRYQNAFISGYKPLVIGKKIDSIQLDVVSGSSLTPIGFNSALDQIKSQAHA